MIADVFDQWRLSAKLSYKFLTFGHAGTGNKVLLIFINWFINKEKQRSDQQV